MHSESKIDKPKSKFRIKKLISQCRYYRGEKKSPWAECKGGDCDAFIWRNNFWNWEASWVGNLTESYRNRTFHNVKEYKLEEFLKEKNIPGSLGDFILYTHIGYISQSSVYWLIGTDEFKSFFEDYYLKLAPMEGNKYTRFYRYYTGGDESDNPFESGSNDGLFWYLEYMFHNCLNHEGDYWDLDSYIETMIQKWIPMANSEELMEKYYSGCKFPLPGLPSNENHDEEVNNKEVQEEDFEEHERMMNRYEVACDLADRIMPGHLGINILGIWKDKHVYMIPVTPIDTHHYKFPLLILVEEEGDKCFASLISDERSMEIHDFFYKEWQKEAEKHCKFYKSEEECPYDENDIRGFFWFSEQDWYWHLFDNRPKFDMYYDRYTALYSNYRLDGRLNSIPVELQTLMFSRYDGIDGFDKVIDDYFQLSPD